MAKHFKEEKTQDTAVMSARRVQRPVQTESHGGYLPYGQAASYRSSYSDAAPTSEYFLDDMPARGGIAAVVRGLLLILAWVARLAALAVVCLVVANVVNVSIVRAQVTGITDLVTSYLPWRSLGLLEVDSPIGGVFRGDLALVSVGLFVLDWLLCRLRASLR